MTLQERLIAIDRALNRHRIAHAFGGAIALAFWTLNPRGTNDIDINVFLPAEDAGQCLRALPEGIEQPPGTEAVIAADGQIRLWWDNTPVDLFFDNLPIHDSAAHNRHTVPFEGTKIPVLGATELAAFKVMFDRTRDWADIEELARAKTLDAEGVRALLTPMLDHGDPRFARLDEAVARGATG